MENFYELASKRRSIRKYEDTGIPLNDIEYFIKSAITAPSGCNSQGSAVNCPFSSICVHPCNVFQFMILTYEREYIQSTFL